MGTFDASKPTEAQIERYLKKKVELAGGYCLKFTSPGFAGVPDRIILLPEAKVVFAELKAPGKTPRQNQKAVQKLLSKLGFAVFGCVDSYAQADEVARTCEEFAKRGDSVIKGIKPCPFCGGKAHVMDAGYPQWVYCEDCGARVHGRVIGSGEGEEAIIKAWNRRV